MQNKSKLAKSERNNEIVRRGEAGESIYKIAKDYDITPTRAYEIFHYLTEGKYKKTLVLKNK